MSTVFEICKSSLGKGFPNFKNLSHHPSPSMCVFYASFTCTYLELFHGRKQKPSKDEDVEVLKKTMLEESKGNVVYI